MLTTIEHRNIIKESTRQSVYTNPCLSGTDTIPYSIKIRSIKVSPIIIFYSPIEYQPIKSSERITIDDLINKYTTTDQGKELWHAANAKLKDELYQDMVSGKLNKVKYYRMIHNMDQKTLVRLSGIMQPNLSRTEQLGYNADISTYKKIAEVFGIEYKELIP